MSTPHTTLSEQLRRDALTRAGVIGTLQERLILIEADRESLVAELREAEKALHALGYEKHGFGWGITICEK